MAKANVLDEWPGVQQRRRSKSPENAWIKPVTYGALNIASASGIVFANKVVFSTYQFRYTCALTWIHTLVTLLGMQLFLAAGMFKKKSVPQLQLAPLAAAYVGYIVLCNLSLNINTVGFYQVMKIAVAPTVLIMELLFFRKIPPPRVVAAVALVCMGIGIATVTDKKLIKNFLGLLVGLAATVVTALYQIWVGTKQKSLQASSMQLLHQYTPQAAVMLGVLMPIMEPLGLLHPKEDTILGYKYTPAAVGAILFSSVLGLLVSLSTFLVIGVTSSLTYNVVGHLKTVIILTGGCLFFGDEMPLKKLTGIVVAMVGMVWYTNMKVAAATQGGGSSSNIRGTCPGDGNSVLPVTGNGAGPGGPLNGSAAVAATPTTAWAGGPAGAASSAGRLGAQPTAAAPQADGGSFRPPATVVRSRTSPSLM